MHGSIRIPNNPRVEIWKGLAVHRKGHFTSKDYAEIWLEIMICPMWWKNVEDSWRVSIHLPRARQFSAGGTCCGTTMCRDADYRGLWHKECEPGWKVPPAEVNHTKPWVLPSEVFQSRLKKNHLQKSSSKNISSSSSPPSVGSRRWWPGSPGAREAAAGGERHWRLVRS